MKKNIFFYFAISFLTLICSDLFARETLLSIKEFNYKKSKNLTIKKINIAGNNKAADSFIRRRIAISEGDRLKPDTVEATIQSLYQTNNFKKVEVYYSQDVDGVNIFIDVDEKYTFIPIPMASYNGDSYNVGIIMLENDFLGQNKKLIFGGLYSNDGWMGMLYFSDPGVEDSSLIYSLFYQGSKREYENSNAEKNQTILRQYQSSNNYMEAALGYKFFNTLYLSGTGGFLRSSVDSSYEKSFNVPESVYYYMAGASIRIQNLKYTSITKTGIETQFRYNRGFSQYSDFKDYNKYRFDFKYSFIPFSDHIISLKLKIGYGDLPDIIEERIGGRDSFKSLPPDMIVADNFVAGSLWYELPFYSNSKIELSATCFAEAGKYERVDMPEEDFKGFGGGFRVYMKGVAMPAMGFDMARNIDTGNLEYSVVVGFTQ